MSVNMAAMVMGSRGILTSRETSWEVRENGEGQGKVSEFQK